MVRKFKQRYFSYVGIFQSILPFYKLIVMDFDRTKPYKVELVDFEGAECYKVSQEW